MVRPRKVGISNGGGVLGYVKGDSFWIGYVLHDSFRVGYVKGDFSRFLSKNGYDLNYVASSKCVLRVKLFGHGFALTTIHAKTRPLVDLDLCWNVLASCLPCRVLAFLNYFRGREAQQVAK